MFAPSEEFAAGHIPRSMNIPLSGQFASWAGTLIDLNSRPVLIADTSEQFAEARTRLARIGLKHNAAFRKQKAAEYGIGFELPGFGLSCTECTENALENEARESSVNY